jgi:hypothetical protein
MLQINQKAMFFLYMIGILVLRLVSWVKTKTFERISTQTTTGIFLEIRTYDYSSGSQTVLCESQGNPDNYLGDPEIILCNGYFEV